MKTQVSKKKIRSLLAEGIDFKLSDQDKKNRELLVSIIHSFINQRKAAVLQMKDKRYSAILLESLQLIKSKFALIEKYNYWRHCLEVVKAQPLIELCLPKESGHHRRIRLTMLGLIDRCREVAAMSSQDYYHRIANNFKHIPS